MYSIWGYVLTGLNIYFSKCLPTLQLLVVKIKYGCHFYILNNQDTITELDVPPITLKCNIQFKISICLTYGLLLFVSIQTSSTKMNMVNREPAKHQHGLLS